MERSDGDDKEKRDRRILHVVRRKKRVLLMNSSLSIHSHPAKQKKPEPSGLKSRSREKGKEEKRKSSAALALPQNRDLAKRKRGGEVQRAALLAC